MFGSRGLERFHFAMRPIRRRDGGASCWVAAVRTGRRFSHRSFEAQTYLSLLASYPMKVSEAALGRRQFAGQEAELSDMSPERSSTSVSSDWWDHRMLAVASSDGQVS